MVSTEDFRNYADKGKKIIDDLLANNEELKTTLVESVKIINLQELQLKSLNNQVSIYEKIVLELENDINNYKKLVSLLKEQISNYESINTLLKNKI